MFFAPKSLGVGLFEPKIYSAIISSKVMLVLGTQPKYFDAIWVKNEWSRFAELIDNGEQKVLIPIFKNMEAGQLPNKLAKYQALDMANISFLQTLTDLISQSVNHKSRVNFNKDSSTENAYLERGFLALEDRNFQQANGFFESVLNLNPHNSQAYFGKLMVEMKISKQEQILTSSKPLKEYSNFEKAVRFADQQLKTVLLQYEENVNNSLLEQKYNESCMLLNDFKIDDIEKHLNNFKELDNYKKSKQIFKQLYDIKDMCTVISECKKSIVETTQLIEKNNNDIKGSVPTIIFRIVGVIIGIILTICLFIEGATSGEGLWNIIIMGVFGSIIILAISFVIGLILDNTVGRLFYALLSKKENIKKMNNIKKLQKCIEDNNQNIIQLKENKKSKINALKENLTDLNTI